MLNWIDSVPKWISTTRQRIDWYRLPHSSNSPGSSSTTASASNETFLAAADGLSVPFVGVSASSLRSSLLNLGTRADSGWAVPLEGLAAVPLVGLAISSDAGGAFLSAGGAPVKAAGTAFPAAGSAVGGDFGLYSSFTLVTTTC